jgi:hypothetical protein
MIWPLEEQGVMMTASATSTGTDPWDIVAYEARMLFDLCRLLGCQEFKPDSNIVNNAVVESACLHARILVDILLSKDSGKGDDIRLSQLLPGYRHPSVEQLRGVYGDGKTERSPCWILNKMIAHPTLKRGTSYDYTSVLKQLLPLIDMVWQAMENHHQAILSKQPKPTGWIDPDFCAKTSSRGW